jgi:hypothetical protein
MLTVVFSETAVLMLASVTPTIVCFPFAILTRSLRLLVVSLVIAVPLSVNALLTFPLTVSLVKQKPRVILDFAGLIHARVMSARVMFLSVSKVKTL